MCAGFISRQWQLPASALTLPLQACRALFYTKAGWSRRRVFSETNSTTYFYLPLFISMTWHAAAFSPFICKSAGCHPALLKRDQKWRAIALQLFQPLHDKTGRQPDDPLSGSPKTIKWNTKEKPNAQSDKSFSIPLKKLQATNKANYYSKSSCWNGVWRVQAEILCTAPPLHSSLLPSFLMMKWEQFSQQDSFICAHNRLRENNQIWKGRLLFLNRITSLRYFNNRAK